MSNNLSVYEPDSTYSEHDWEVFSKWIKGILSIQSVKISFTKKNGSTRVLNGTLCSDLLPEQPITESKSTRKASTTSIPVYDLDLKEWRSFSIKSVKRVEFEIND